MTEEPPANAGNARRAIPLTRDLLDLLRQRMEQRRVGYRALADQTAGEVSRTAVHRILTGQQRSVWPKTLASLVEVLQIAPEELARAMGPAGTPWVLPERFDHVPPLTRRYLEGALTNLLDVAGLLAPGSADPPHLRD